MSIRLDYDTKLWCVVLMCTRQVVYMSISLQQCKDKYPKALLYGKEQGMITRCHKCTKAIKKVWYNSTLCYKCWEASRIKYKQMLHQVYIRVQ